jgi:hypothetical protein
LIPNRPSTHLHVPPTIFKRDHASIAHSSVHPTSLARASSAFAPSTRRNSRVDANERRDSKSNANRRARASVAPRRSIAAARTVVGSRRFASRSRRARVALASSTAATRLATTTTTTTTTSARRRPREDVDGNPEIRHPPTDRFRARRGMKNLSPDCARLGCLEPDRRFANRDAGPSPKTVRGDAVGARERSRGTWRRIQHPEVARTIAARRQTIPASRPDSDASRAAAAARAIENIGRARGV